MMMSLIDAARRYDISYNTLWHSREKLGCVYVGYTAWVDINSDPFNDYLKRYKSKNWATRTTKAVLKQRKQLQEFPEIYGTPKVMKENVEPKKKRIPKEKVESLEVTYLYKGVEVTDTVIGGSRNKLFMQSYRNIPYEDVTTKYSYEGLLKAAKKRK
jgi:hypothetical protein